MFVFFSWEITLFHKESLFTSQSNSHPASLVCCLSVSCVWVENCWEGFYKSKQYWKDPQMVNVQGGFSRVEATFLQLLWFAVYHQCAFELKIPRTVFTSWSNVEKVLRWLTCSVFHKPKKQSQSFDLLYYIIMRLGWKFLEMFSQVKARVVQLWFAVYHYEYKYYEFVLKIFPSHISQVEATVLQLPWFAVCYDYICWKVPEMVDVQR